MTQSACTGRNTNKLYAIKAEWRAHPVCICKARCSCNQCIVKSLWLALASLLIHQAHVKRWPHQKRKEADHFSSMSMALLSCRTITVFDSHNSLTHIKYPEPIVREINGTIVVRRSEFARIVIRQSASPPHKMRAAASVYGQTDGLRKWHRIKIPNRRGEKVMQIKMWNTYRNQVHDQTTTILVLCAEGASVRVFDAVDQHRDRKKKNIYSFMVHILLCFMLGYFCFFFFGSFIMVGCSFRNPVEQIGNSVRVPATILVAIRWQRRRSYPIFIGHTVGACVIGFYVAVDVDALGIVRQGRDCKYLNVVCFSFNSCRVNLGALSTISGRNGFTILFFCCCTIFLQLDDVNMS